jgi:hypothetical protein
LPDPLLGPTGQPLNPNPFIQQQTVSVNTQPAEQAFANLQKVLDNITKSFGANWEKVSHDGMAAQERFWRYVGDKAAEKQIALKRYSSEAIAGIEAEKNAKIAAYEAEERAGKRTHEELRKASINASEEAAKAITQVNDETARKARQSTGLGGFIRGRAGAISEAIGGGPVGSLITTGASILTNPWALATGAVLQMLNTRAEFARTGVQLAGAGFRLGGGAGTGLEFATNLFGGPLSNLGQALSRDQQREIIAMMAGSRTMVDQARTGGGFAAIRGNLGLFANILPDASKEMELFTDATKSLGMSQRDITNLFISTRVNSERLKITQLDAIATQIEMQKSLRNITNDGLVAATVLGNIGGFLKGMGTTSEVERNRITLGIAQAGANLTLPQIAGMFAFTHGGRIPNPEQIFGEQGLLRHGGVFGLMGGFLNQVGGQFTDPTQRMFAADVLRQQFMPGLRLQDIPQFFNIATAMQQPGANIPALTKQFEALERKTPQAAMAEGIATLAEIVDPIKRLENIFTNFWTMIDARINRLIEAINPRAQLMRVENWVSKNILHRPSGQSGRQ